MKCIASIVPHAHVHFFIQTNDLKQAFSLLKSVVAAHFLLVKFSRCQ